MRLIGTLNNKQSALAFSHFLDLKGISHQLDIQTDTDWGSPNYGSSQCHIWIVDEDQVEEALKWLRLFINNPHDPQFQLSANSSLASLSSEKPGGSPPPLPSSSPQQKPAITAWEMQPMGWVTKGILIICCSLLALTEFLMTSTPVPERYAGFILFTSPVDKALLYDYPKFYELVDRFIRLYGYEGLENSSKLPAEGQQLQQKINRTPYWSGIYPLLIKGGFEGLSKNFKHYHLFEKIREGEVWRLFSPILLHADIFHLFFNMLWLIVLGKQIEQRLKTGRYVLFILLIAMISNTAQYLVSGPNFIGFSGVLCGMLAFIWVRQINTAWEGYKIDRITLIFMFVFIASMALIQLLSFFFEKALNFAFSPNIANTAHLTGGLAGYFFGKLNFFRWRHT
jgi:GlpG protein